jgi:hypothetical protein
MQDAHEDMQGGEETQHQSDQNRDRRRPFDRLEGMPSRPRKDDIPEEITPRPEKVSSGEDVVESFTYVVETFTYVVERM